MPRLRYCRICTSEAPLDHPDRRPNRLFPDAPGAVWHPLDAWPHDPERLRPAAPAVHDDWSYRRAYGDGIRSGLLGDLNAKLPPELATRQGHREYLRRHGLAEGAPDTPGRAPSAVEIARKKRLFQKAFERAKRKG